MNKPARIDPLADRVLGLLSGDSSAGEIVLGGYLALQHHADYRETHDIDAWWRGRASPAAEEAIRRTMRQVAAERGDELRERRFGETISFDLVHDGRRHFSFQIAVRSVELEPPVQSAWPPVLLEHLSDTVGSKMNALVDRGSPRDFLDIRMVVTAGLATIGRCWDFWSRKNPGQAVEQAKQKVLLHLRELEGRRPVESIALPAQRRAAHDTREWFRREFVRP